MPGTFTIGNQGGSAFGLEIEMEPSPFIIVASFDKMGQDIRSFKVPLQRAIKEVVAPSLQHNFEVGGRPSWAELLGTTVAKRRRKGYGPTPILVQTGTLKRVSGQLNLWKIDGQEGVAQLADLPSRAWYGYIHQTGEGIWTSRPWAVIQADDEDGIQRIFEEWIEERVEANLARFGRG